MYLTANELPDHLPVMLEYLSFLTRDEARAMLADCGHLLRAIGHALQRRRSRYASVIEALLGLAGEAELGAAPPRSGADTEPDLDHDWEERPAFEAMAPAAETAVIRFQRPRRQS